VLGLQSLRFRLAAAYIIGTLFVAGVVAGATYLLVSRTLTSQRVQALTGQSFTGFRRVHNFLDTVREYSTNDIVTNLQTRGNEVVVIMRGQAFASSARVNEDDIPRDLRRAVHEGKVGYEITSSSPRQLIFGSRVPDVPDHEAFFFFSFAQLDRTLSILRKICFVVVAGAAAIAGAAGFELAGRTIRPLRLAADAARQVAEGNLDTRLEERGEDELGQLARAFNGMTETLTERIARERRFVADASHELRTPLTALKTSIDYLAERSGDLPSKLRGPLALAADEVRSFQRLVDDLLELTRAEAGNLDVSLEEVDLRDFATQVVRRRAPETPVDIRGPEGLIVRTDKMRLERVVGNLLENAVFHGAGKDVHIILEAQNGDAKITVSDQGPGIDSEQIGRIFERFWRGDTARRRDGRVGSGLGLAIARENAMLIGADIGVSSEPGVGTRFEVVLPRSEGEA
jgi:two-component system, OmpR family, sensor histidine kinase MtrB